MQYVCVIKAIFDLSLCISRTPRNDILKLNCPPVMWLLPDHSGMVRF